MHSEDRSHSGGYTTRSSQSFKARSQSWRYRPEQEPKQQSVKRLNQPGNLTSESSHSVLNLPSSPEELPAQPSEKKLSELESQSTHPSGSSSETPDSGSSDDSGDLDIIPSIPENERLNLKYEAVSCWVPNNTGSVSLFEGLKPNLSFLRKKKDSKEEGDGGKAPSSRQVCSENMSRHRVSAWSGHHQGLELVIGLHRSSMQQQESVRLERFWLSWAHLAAARQLF